MNGLPPTNPPLSCSEQMSNTISIPKLDTSYQILSGLRSECGDTDGEYLSNSTTPLNYMRHISPTSKDESIILGKNSSAVVACEPTCDVNLNLNNLNISYSAGEIFTSQPALNIQNSCLLYGKSGSDALQADYDLSCGSIDTEFGINSNNGDIMSSIDYNSALQKPLHPPMDTLFVPSDNCSSQRAEERRNCLYTSSPSTTASWEPECCSTSLALPPPAAAQWMDPSQQQWLQGAGAGAGSLQRSSSGEHSGGSYERSAACYPAAVSSMFSPQQAPQQLQSSPCRAYSSDNRGMGASPPSAALRRAVPVGPLPYATAKQTPLPIVLSQSHQQQYSQQQQLTRSPPQLSMQPQQQQQYQQAGVGEAYYGHMGGGVPARAVQQLQGYATVPHYGEAPALPMPPSRSNAAAGYRPSPVPMQHAQHHYQQQHQHQASAAMGMPHLQDLIYQVQFKRGCRSFTLAPRANFNVSVHDFVVVEGDRGEDLGIVVEVLGMQAFMERRMNMPRSAAQQDQDDQNVGCILRLATLQERQMLPDKFHTEKDIVQSCNELAFYGFGLPIVVLDAELQFDRRKLTLYYDCSVRIDFRDFVRQLYATYKARIWMKKLDAQLDQQQQQLEVQPFAAMALATGVQFSQGQGSSSSSSDHHSYSY